jgi:hypothetical protein
MIRSCRRTRGGAVFDRRKKKWGELTATQQRAVVAGAAVQLVLQIAALWDLRRRSAEELRGSRRWWTAAAFVNVVGPIAYFAVGRRRPDGARRKTAPARL